MVCPPSSLHGVGDSEGLGTMREMELARFADHMGLSNASITVAHHEALRDGLTEKWNRTLSSALLLRVVNRVHPDAVSSASMP